MIRNFILKLILTEEEQESLGFSEKKKLFHVDKYEKIRPIIKETQLQEYNYWYCVAESASFSKNDRYNSTKETIENTLRSIICNLAKKHQYKYVYTDLSEDEPLYPHRPTFADIIPEQLLDKIDKKEYEEELYAFNTHSFISYPWNTQRYSIMSSVQLQSEWRKDSNHRISFYLPMKLGFFNNGMHSGFSGIMLNLDNTFNPGENGVVYDVSKLLENSDITKDLKFVYKDDKLELKEEIDPLLWELALIFKLQKVIQNDCQWM